MPEPAPPAERLFALHAYGLTVQSPFALPELEPGDPLARPDLRIISGRAEALELADKPFRVHWDEAGNARLTYPDGVTFAVHGGHEIVVDAAPGLDERILRVYLLGPVLAVALHQRGWLVLHASAVAIGGQAVGFLGAAGWGKSTLAAALQRRGHPLVADDLIAVPAMTAGGLPLIYPGYPQLRLWPEVAASLGADVNALPYLRPDLAKRVQRLDSGFARAALPLGRLYVLADGEPAGLERLGKQAAVLELVRHSYLAPGLPLTAAGAHLRQCAALVEHVGLSRLQRPHTLPDLPAVAQMIERDLDPAAAGQRDDLAQPVG